MLVDEVDVNFNDQRSGRTVVGVVALMLAALSFVAPRLRSADVVASSVGVSPNPTPVSQTILSSIDQLPSFVCTELIERYKGYLDGTAQKRIDRLTANVSFEVGAEQYTNVRRNGRPTKSILHLRGAWSQGEFGTLLTQSVTLLRGNRAVLTRKEVLNAKAMTVYSFFVSDTESPWVLEVAGSRQPLSFWTELWTSEKTGVIEKVERRSQNAVLDNGISEIRWSVTLAPMEMNGTRRLLPSMAEYAVAYASDGRLERNAIRFSGYKRYGSEAKIQFGPME